MTEFSDTSANIDPSLLRDRDFAQDPFAFLRQESRRMFRDVRVVRASEAQRGDVLDEYFRKIESLDRANFSDMQGRVCAGVPQGYLPDGFIDMGAVSSLSPPERYGRLLNYVDTYKILQRHRALFDFVFNNIDPNDSRGEDNEISYQQLIISNVAREIAMTLPYGEPIATERGGILPISALNTAECQQHALTAQVLLQAFGIRSRLSKNFYATQKEMDSYGPSYCGGDHVSNVITIDGPEERVYMFDSTNPQVGRQGEWMFGLFRMNQRSHDGGWLVTTQVGTLRKYTERNNMFWTIRRQNSQ